MAAANSAPNRAAPIGIFDSGLGGLTVVRAVRERLPEEQIVYLGDNARVPYGTRSAKTVLTYARACAHALLREHGIKLLVVACNTVSAVALNELAAELEIPVLGVIGPGARAGVRHSQRGRIGVIATLATADSGAYPRAIAAADPNAEAFVEAAPLLVPLAEEGWTEGEVPGLAVRRYLEPLVRAKVDTLVLGCTHYPLLRGVIVRELEQTFGSAIPVVDSAEATAEELAQLLATRGLDRRPETASPEQDQDRLELLVTDMPKRFGEAASRFLGRSVTGLSVRAIDL